MHTDARAHTRLLQYTIAGAQNSNRLLVKAEDRKGGRTRKPAVFLSREKNFMNDDSVSRSKVSIVGSLHTDSFVMVW